MPQGPAMILKMPISHKAKKHRGRTRIKQKNRPVNLPDMNKNTNNKTKKKIKPVREGRTRVEINSTSPV